LDDLPVPIPDAMREFWRTTRDATLFKDHQYGQWGIELLEPKAAIAEARKWFAARPRNFTSADLVVGRFFGDSDLIVINCDPAQSQFGSVTIALPIDRRPDWPVVAESFTDFLEKMLAAQGDKYWEVR
jgi:hypothetical protein